MDTIQLLYKINNYISLYRYKYCSRLDSCFSFLNQMLLSQLFYWSMLIKYGQSFASLPLCIHSDETRVFWLCDNIVKCTHTRTVPLKCIVNLE